MNFLLPLLGWFAWNALHYNFTKDPYDDRNEAFSFRDYARKQKDNWVANGSVCIIIIAFMHFGLELKANAFLDVEHLGLAQIWYLLSGFITEIILVGIKKWYKKNKNQ